TAADARVARRTAAVDATAIREFRTGWTREPGPANAIDVELSGRAYDRGRYQRQRSPRAHARDHDIAEMAARVRVEAIVVVDEIRRERRLVLRPQQRNRIALQAIDNERTAGLQALNDCRIARVAQLFAGAPERAAAHRAIDVSGRIVAVTDGDAAIVVAMVRQKADRIFIRDGKPEIAARRIVRAFRPETQHAIFARLGKRLVIIGAGRLAALGNQHVAVVVEQNFRNFRAPGGAARDADFEPRVVSKRAVGQDRHRPDAQARGDRVIKTAAVSRDTEHTPRRGRISPRGRIAAVEFRTLDIQAFARIEGDRRQSRRSQRLHTVIETAAINTVEREAMDHAGVAVGNKQLTRRRIECKSAQRRTGIRDTAKGDVGEKCDRASAAVDLPDRSGSAIGNYRTN